jgi:hypothetical protein
MINNGRTFLSPALFIKAFNKLTWKDIRAEVLAGVYQKKYR